MKEISNKTLTILLVIAIAVSLGGAFTSLSRLAAISALPITGFATSGTGKVNLSITETTSVAISGNIDFGSGYINSTSNFVRLEGNASSYSTMYGNGT